MIARPARLAELRAALKRSRVVALIGPRQSGKTTLARQIVPADSPNYFDLEDPVSLARLAEPMTTLASLGARSSSTRSGVAPTSFRRCASWRIGGAFARGS
jgi:predicted AAA+ superfamily ATPase